MKVDTEIVIAAPPESIWAILADFPRYGEWNPYITGLRGQAAPDAEMQIDFQYLRYGSDKPKKATEKARVTALAPPKYLSLLWRHGRGAWWLSAEYVFRLKQRDDGKVFFFNEVFFTGLSIVKLLGFLDFRRDAVKQKVLLSMMKMNEALKAKAEAQG